jgi:hypothetical protein
MISQQNYILSESHYVSDHSIHHVYRLEIYWLMQLITSQYEYLWYPTSILIEIHKYFGTVNTMQPYILWQNTQIPTFLLEITVPSQKEPEVQ